MQVTPSSSIQIGASGMLCFAVVSTGSHMSKNTAPNARQLAARNFNGLLRSPGAFRNGPRNKIISTSAVSHSTGVLKNHS